MARPRKNVPEANQSLSHEDALAEIQRLRDELARKEAAEKKVAKPATASPEQLAEIEALKSALLSSRRKEAAGKALAERAADEPVFEVTNAVDMALVANVRDHRGEEIHLMWPQKGAIQYLTAAQVWELQERAKHFFANGYLIAPELVEPSVNAIPDFDAFLTKGADATSQIEQMTSVDVLVNLYHHINGLRFQITEDESTIPRGESGLKHVPLDAQIEVILHAVVRRVFQLAKIRLSADVSL
jgi:hypothetical protein